MDDIHANRTDRSHTPLPNEPYWSMTPDQLRRLPALPANRQKYSPELGQAVRNRYTIYIERFGYGG